MHAAHMRKVRLFSLRSKVLSAFVVSPLCLAGLAAVVALRGSGQSAQASVFVEHGIPISTGTPSAVAPLNVAAPVHSGEIVSRIAPAVHLPDDPLASLVIVEQATGTVRVFGLAESESTASNENESHDEGRGEKKVAAGMVERARFRARERRGPGDAKRDGESWEVFATQDVVRLADCRVVGVNA